MLAENRDHPDQDQVDGIADESPITTTGHAKHELGHTIDDVADDSRRTKGTDEPAEDDVVNIAAVFADIMLSSAIHINSSDDTQNTENGSDSPTEKVGNQNQ